MKPFALIAPVLALAGALAVPATAQQGEADIPDLRGVWISMATECHHPEAMTEEVVVEFNITEQDGPFLRGVKSWAHEGETFMDAGGELVGEASEIVVGVIRGDGVTILFTEHDDLGQHHMRLIDDNTIEDVYAESGQAATICIQTLTRQPS
ncbi:MAG: hypothetical protein AAF414_11640 [Pseudomonadota bacterium]